MSQIRVKDDSITVRSLFAYVDFTHHTQGFEARHADFFYSFTFDDISQLDRDISTALATRCEWRSSFIHINHIPLDVLSLIPTHLYLQRDCFHTSFVCCHWRGTFLQHAILWSQLYLRKGEAYMRTLLERVKGSALDIITSSTTPPSAITLLFPHTATQVHPFQVQPLEGHSKIFGNQFWTTPTPSYPHNHSH